jgi:hypothetical protein
MKGWVKISRDIINWEWFDTPGMVQLFIYILVKANYTDKEWHDMTIRRGQMVTSVAKICADTGLSTQVVRTCLNRLKMANTITINATNKYTIVTINRYDDYQAYDACDYDEDNEQNNKQITSEQQANNKQITTTKEKEERKNNNNTHTDYLLETLSRTRANTQDSVTRTEVVMHNTHTDYLLETLSRTRANTQDSVTRMAAAAEVVMQRVRTNEDDRKRYESLTNVDRGFIFFWARYPQLMMLFEESLSYHDFIYINERYEVSDIQRVIEAMANKLPIKEKRLGSFLATFKQWAVSDYQIAEKKRLGNPKYA